MRIATWNINSIRIRVERVLAFLERENIDVLALQETKCKTEQFPTEPFEQAGYSVSAHGLNQWNGVAIISRLPIVETQIGFPDQPAWGEPAVVEARALGATVIEPTGTKTTIWSLYIPNGRELDDPHYQYKLEWLTALADFAGSQTKKDPETRIALVGDWNIAPLDEDVWDIEYFNGRTHVSTPERDAFDAFTNAGFSEVTRDKVTNYTYWDYQKLRFPKNEGMRIDFVYASDALANSVTRAKIDRDERKGKGASDHVPVIVETT